MTHDLCPSSALRLLAVLCLLLVLSGCASPSPGFLGAARHDVSVDGQRFVVHLRDTDAQVIRMDRLTAANRPGMAARMGRAAETASGCAVVPGSLMPQGGAQSAVARVDLRCD